MKHAAVIERAVNIPKKIRRRLRSLAAIELQNNFALIRF